MTREFLKNLGIEDKETADKIMAEYGKEINTLKQQNTELSEKLNTFNDYEEIKGFKDKYEELTNKYSELENKHKSEITKGKVENLLTELLYKAGVKDLKIARNSLDIGEIQDFSDDTAKNLSDKVNSLKTDYDYLFYSEKAPSAKDVGFGKDPAEPKKTDTLIEKFLERNPNIKREDLNS